MIIRSILESRMSDLSLECFPIKFGPFFKILWYFEKNRYFEGMARLQYTGSQSSTPLTKSQYSTRLTFRWKYFLLCVGWPSNFLPWIAWNPEMSIGILKKFLQRLDTFLGHFEVILFKSQKSFWGVTRYSKIARWVLSKKLFVIWTKSLQSVPRKYLGAAETFWEYILTSLGSGQSVAESLKVIRRIEENIFNEKYTWSNF